MDVIKQQKQMAKLQSLLESVAPIHGFCADPPRIDFKDEATDAEKAAAQSVFSAFDFDADFQTADDAKTELKSKLDAEAETIRQRFITSSGVGQAMVYQEKYDEAKRIQTDPAPDASSYPLLSAEVSLRGATMKDVANVVVMRANQWRAVAGQIENIRQKGKLGIDAATTVGEAQAAYDSIDWSTIPNP